MKTILGLSYNAVLPIAATVILYFLNNRTSFGKLDNKVKQCIYGVIFGGLAIISTEFGVDVGGAVANTRDSSVLTAGLVFGSPAGIIAGLIGGIERFFAVYWGAGTYTRVACTLSTILAGFISAALRRYMFDNKKPSVAYSLAIGIVTEVIHMLMIFVTNFSDIETSFVFIKKCAIPMITVNALTVMLSVLAVSILGKNKVTRKRRSRQIATVAQRWLLNCVIVAFIITCVFTSILQYQISDNNIDELLRININDVVSDISDASDRNLLSITEKVAKDCLENPDLIAIAQANNIAEINIVNKYGYISASTNEDFINYDMSSGGQSAEFMVLLLGERTYVQSYQPISYDSSISRKYAGVAFETGGFVQVGYDADNFQVDIDKEVVNAAVNRHVGQNGYIFIADKDFKVVSTRQGKDKKAEISDININSDVKEGERFIATFYGEEAYCMYQMSEGYYIVGVFPTEEADLTRDLSIYMMVFMEIVIFVGLFILIYFLIKKLVVDNIKSVNKSLDEITGGNLNVTVNVRSNEEFASLSDDINATVDTLKRYIEEAAARIDRELELAKVIQESSLPSVFPPFPEKKELDVFASMTAAKEVGGDFYDFYLLDENHLAFLVADVSGKGITGAMFMMKAKTLIKSFAERGGDAAQILISANNALCEGNEAEMFVTCFMGILDLANGKIEYANAGHNPPLLRRKDGTFEYFKVRAGFVLGGMENIQYRKGEIEFSEGDTIFIYTDGVTEATDAEEKLYGEERLQQILNNTGDKTAQEICCSVKADVDSFVGEAPQFDDITMLCIRLV